MSDETLPHGVPELAIYDALYKHWGVGEVVDKCRNGTWSWYPNGEDSFLSFEQVYDEGRLIGARSFYPDGALKSTTAYCEEGRKCMAQSFYIERAHDWVRLLAGSVTFHPSEAPDGTYEIRKIAGSVPVSYEFYNEAGNKLRREDSL